MGVQDFFGGGDDRSQKTIHAATGSFTGYYSPADTIVDLGRTGYLSATRVFKQPLCGNEEGWGPMSPFRYDFTPCFIDVWVAIVAVFGLVAGSIAVWWLLRWRRPTNVAKDWHFWTKQVSKVRMEAAVYSVLGLEQVSNGITI